MNSTTSTDSRENLSNLRRTQTEDEAGTFHQMEDATQPTPLSRKNSLSGSMEGVNRISPGQPRKELFSVTPRTLPSVDESDFSHIENVRVRDFARQLHYEEQRVFNPAKIAQAKRIIQQAHDSKKDTYAAFTSAKYLEATPIFYEGIGVSREELSEARGYTALSGTAYGLPQVAIYPTRLLNGKTLAPAPASLQSALLHGRGVAHANLGGLANPACDVLADLWKKGAAVPYSWYVGTSRKQVNNDMAAAHDFVSKALVRCKEQGIAFPAQVVDYLKAARASHIGKNATQRAFHQTALVSQLGEAVKAVVDIAVATGISAATAATAGAAAVPATVAAEVGKAAIKGLTAPIYFAVGAAEEVAISELIKIQNAKYAPVMNKDGSVNEKVARSLWKRESEVKLSYLEMAAKRDIAKQLQKTREAQSHAGYLKGILEQPRSLREIDLNRKIQDSRDRIEFLTRRQAKLADQIVAGQSGQLSALAGLIEDVKAGGSDPALADSLCAEYADLIQKESSRLSGGDGKLLSVIKAYIRSRGLDDSRQSAEPGTRTTDPADLHPLRATMYKLGTGAHFHRAAARDIALEEKKIALLEDLRHTAISNDLGDSPGLSDGMTQRISAEIALQEDRATKYRTSAELAIKDLNALVKRDFASLNPDGLSTAMLNSSWKFYREALKAKYDQPGMLSRGVLERGALSIGLAAIFGGHIPKVPDIAIDGMNPLGNRLLNDVLEEGPGQAVVGLGIHGLVRGMAERTEHSDLTVRMRAPQADGDLQQTVQDVFGLEPGQIPDWVPAVNLGAYAHNYGLLANTSAMDIDSLPSTGAVTSAGRGAKQLTRKAAQVSTNVLKSFPDRVKSAVTAPYNLATGRRLNRENLALQKEIQTYNASADDNWFTQVWFKQVGHEWDNPLTDDGGPQPGR